MNESEILRRLKLLSNPRNVEGMARYGINPNNTYGVPIPRLREIAKESGKNHDLAQRLWKSGIHEARILASMVDDPGSVTELQMDTWVRDFDSWDVCDQCCSNLFEKTKFAHKKLIEWCSREEEFTKRAGFVLMARLAFKDKTLNDEQFGILFSIIERESVDERNYVKKAINWALRQIGKRNKYLNEESIKIAQRLKKSDSKSAGWIANDAIRELTGTAVQKLFNKPEK